MLQLFSLSPALVVPTVAPAPAVQIVQQRAAMLVEPSLPTPFLIAKEGIPKVQYDYTRGLDELNGIDVWADIQPLLRSAEPRGLIGFTRGQ